MNNDELNQANIDILTVVVHAKRMIGWDTINCYSLHRVMYLMKVLYSFCHNDKNKFNNYHFNVSIFGPYSELVEKSLIFLLSNQYLLGEKDGEVQENQINTNLKDCIEKLNEEKSRWIDTILLILGKYGENKIFSFIVNDPQYEQSVKANLSSEIDIDLENYTLKVLKDFKQAFEDTLRDDTSNISKEEYISLYFDYLFSQIINRH